MPRMPSKPTLSRDTRGYWFTQWYADGKRKTHTFGHSSKISDSLAQRRFKNWLVVYGANPAAAARFSGDTLTVEQLVGFYQAWANDYYRHKDRTPTGESDKVMYALKGMVGLFGRLEGDAVGAQHLKAYRDRMIDEKYARTTINAWVNIVRRWAKWCIAEHGMNPSVLASLQAVAGLKAGRSEAVEPDGVVPVPEVVIDHTKTHLPEVLGDMIDLQLLTAMRPGELCMMRPRDIDTGHRTWSYRPRQHKTEHFGHTRVIFLGGAARAIVAKYLKRQTDAPLFSPVEAVAQRRGKSPQRRVTTGYDTRSYRRAIYYAVAAYNKTVKKGQRLEPWGPGRLRHNALTRIERECGGDAARAVGGHRYVETTQRNYIERDMKLSREVAERVG